MSASKSGASDVAGKEHWDQLWSSGAPPSFKDPTQKTLRDPVAWKTHLLLSRLLAGRRRHGATLLEVGCAGSYWLPYFQRHLGFEVTGLDYSDIGCERARSVLRQAGASGEIVCGDFFDPPARLVGAFDVVVSFGVAEHFRPTAGCISAFASLLAPGGAMVTMIPNFGKTLGSVQRWLDRELYDKHVPLTADDLSAAHVAAGLVEESSGYLMFANLGILGFGHRMATRTGRAASKLAGGLSIGISLLEDAVPMLRPNPYVSPFAWCLAEKPR